MLPQFVRLSAIATAATLLACGSDGPVDPSSVPTFYGGAAAANPVNTLSAIVTVEAARYDSAAVRFWRSGEEPSRTAAYAFEGDSVLQVPVLGLHASSSYTLETLLYAGGGGGPVDTATFSTGALPAWIPSIGALGSDTTPGFLSLSLPDGPVIVDNAGRVVWYAHVPGGALNSFQAHANGRYTLPETNDPVRFRVLDETGEEVGSIACQGYKTRFHDLMILRDGDYWIMCDEVRTLDLSQDGGNSAASVSATVIQHISATGQLLFEWSAFDHFQITDLPLDERTGTSVNFTHGNGLELDEDGNILVSFRSLSEITKINSTTGQVMWRLGGLANQFTLEGDPKGTFERQHGIRRSGPGQIQLLDNGAFPPSRLVRYLINPVTMTARFVTEFLDASDTFTPVGGATDYYPNGHALVSFGRAGRVVEIDEVGNRAWEVTGVDGLYVFRAERIADLYRPTPLSRSGR